MRIMLPFQGWRLTFLQGVIFAVFLIFTLRMYQLQIVNNADAQLAADDNRLSQLPIPSDRGVIFDRNDRTLARNVPAYVVRIIPAELPANREQELAIFNRISALTGVPPTRAIANASGQNIRSIEELVAEGEGIAPFRPVPVAQDVPLEVALRIREESYDLPGVDILEGAVRQYPTGSLTSHIIGYMGPIGPDEAQELIALGYDPAFDRIGYGGVEAYLETVLSGERGLRLREVDVAGQEISLVRQVDPIAGQNVRLTLDVELQAAAEQAVSGRINFINAQARNIVTQNGVIIAMNPQTGEILAMVSWPTYDNTRFARAIDAPYYFDLLEDPTRPLLNQAISGVYPPGSTWKLITAVGVLEEDIVNPETRLLDEGDLILPNAYAEFDTAADQRFVCWNREGHGPMNMVEALSNSCNVYFYQVGGGNPEVSEAALRRGGLDITDLFRYATALGIGSELGVGLTGERAGRMPDRNYKRINIGENWSTGDTYNAAVGQGYILTTPIQLVNSIAAIINDGTVYRPTVIREYLDAERNITRPFVPEVIRTANLDRPNPDGSLTLLLVEDMIMQGQSSLACTCEPSSNWFNEARCDPENYRAIVDINPDPFLEETREYIVSLPENYPFNRRVCDPIRWNANYTPAFMSTTTLDYVRRGMRQAVTSGTAQAANLPYITVAGKTGTAEYCDDIAGPLGLCVPGNWPAHAWFAAYASYENPEILVVGFVYNGGEGSANAVPIVVETLEAYVRLQEERAASPALAQNP